MKTSNFNFNNFSQEAETYINDLANELGRPEEKQRVYIIWKSVMHVIRDRIKMGESLDFISQMPLILKGAYVENWKYHEKPPLDYDTVEEMNEKIEQLQKQRGETEFKWELTTDEITNIVIDSMKRYITPGQLEHVREQLPKELQQLVQ